MINQLIIKCHQYLRKEGLFVLIIHVFNFLIFSFFKKPSFFKTPFHKYKIYLNNEVRRISKNKIITGPYKGVFFEDNIQVNAGFSDYASKFLGVYELQIQNLIIKIQKKYNLKTFINIGAGDGYHIISLIKNNYFKHGVAFEINNKNKNILKNNLISNKIKKKVQVFGEGNVDQIKKLVSQNKIKLNKTLFLIDIEGGEFSLFNNNNINFFTNSFLIIEDHSIFMKENNQNLKNFYNLIKKYFKINIIKNGSRHPRVIDGLKDFTDDECWLMMSEGRGKNMWWLLLSPKKL